MINPVNIPPVYREEAAALQRQHKQIINEEYASLGSPRIDMSLLLDLQALATQKQVLINKHGLIDNVPNNNQ